MTDLSRSTSGWRIAAFLLVLLVLGGALWMNWPIQAIAPQREPSISEEIAQATVRPASNPELDFAAHVNREVASKKAAEEERNQNPVRGQLLSYFDSVPIEGAVRVFQDSEIIATVPTDSEGRFEWAPPGEGEYFIELHREEEGGLFFPLPNHLVEGHSESRWKETSTRVVVKDVAAPIPSSLVYGYRPPSISGKVITNNGDPIEGAFIEVRMRYHYGIGGWHNNWTVTDAEGIFSIPQTIPGTGQLAVSLPEDAEGWIPPGLVEIFLNAEEHKVLEPLVARKGTSEIRGVVIDQFGEPFEDLEIWCQVVGQPFSTKAMASTTNLKGEFSFPGLPHGDFTILPTRASYPEPARDTEGKVAWWVWPIPVAIESEGSITNIGEVVVPRPNWFKQTIHFVRPEGSTADQGSSDLRIKVVEDDAIQAIIRAIVVAGVKESRPYDWLNSPPWFNYEPFQEWSKTEDGYALEIACLAPHAPIEIFHYGRIGKRGLIHTVYPVAGDHPALTISLGE